MKYQKKICIIVAFLACITIDSVMKMDKRKYPQVYLGECQHKEKYTNV